MQCSENYYGPNCATFCVSLMDVYVCDSVGGLVCIESNRDMATNCTTCLPGYNPLTNCRECLTGRDASTNCTTCLPGYDPSTDCTVQATTTTTSSKHSHHYYYVYGYAFHIQLIRVSHYRTPISVMAVRILLLYSQTIK